MNKIIATGFAVALVLSNLFSACSSFSPDPNVHFRSVFVLAASSAGTGTLSGSAPFTVGIMPEYSPNHSDLNRPASGVVTKVEADYGEGEGFVDITDASRDLWALSGQGSVPFDQLIQHTYFTPGSYTIRVRMTFWDGAMLLSDLNSPMISVT